MKNEIGLAPLAFFLKQQPVLPSTAQKICEIAIQNAAEAEIAAAKSDKSQVPYFRVL